MRKTVLSLDRSFLSHILKKENSRGRSSSLVWLLHPQVSHCAVPSFLAQCLRVKYGCSGSSHQVCIPAGKKKKGGDRATPFLL